jgi:hypothetical protein
LSGENFPEPHLFFKLEARCFARPRGTWTGKMNPQKKDWSMQARLFVLSLAISIGCGIAVQRPAFSQENRGTMEQQMACTPDVFRLCGDQIPDVDRIVACLRQNTPQLSGPCRAVFEPNVSANQQAAPRRRDDRPRRRDDRPRPYDDDQ